jgi:hypothetical protein
VVKLFTPLVAALGLCPVTNNQTRWNFTYLMLKQALKLQVQINSFIQEYINLREHSLLAADILSKEDWQVLQTV